MGMTKIYAYNRNDQNTANALLTKYCMMQYNTSSANQNITAYEL